jgi:hypothetical protein
MKTDESNIGIWLWLALIIIVNATWISMDIWLRANGHEFLTTEFREGLRNPFWGPFLCGAIAFTVVVFVAHMALKP